MNDDRIFFENVKKERRKRKVTKRKKKENEEKETRNRSKWLTKDFSYSFLFSRPLYLVRLKISLPPSSTSLDFQGWLNVPVTEHSIQKKKKFLNEGNDRIHLIRKLGARIFFHYSVAFRPLALDRDEKVGYYENWRTRLAVWPIVLCNVYLLAETKSYGNHRSWPKSARSCGPLCIPSLPHLPPSKIVATPFSAPTFSFPTHSPTVSAPTLCQRRRPII